MGLAWPLHGGLAMNVSATFPTRSPSRPGTSPEPEGVELELDSSDGSDLFEGVRPPSSGALPAAASAEPTPADPSADPDLWAQLQHGLVRSRQAPDQARARTSTATANSPASGPISTATGAASNPTSTASGPASGSTSASGPTATASGPASGSTSASGPTATATGPASGPTPVSAVAGAPALERTTIQVHGHELQVEYDPKVASAQDVEDVQTALNRYPEKWVDGGFDAAGRNGEPKPTLKLVSAEGMPQGKSAPEGLFVPKDDTIYLNMTRLHDPEKGAPRDLRTDPESYDGPLVQGSKWLQRTAIHEFAHYLDDAGFKDPNSGLIRPPMASAAGPWERTTPVSEYRRAHHHSGHFKQRVRERNEVFDDPTRSPSQYVSPYEQQANFHSTKEHETFAEIVTELVVGGNAARRRFARDPVLHALSDPVIRYLDSGLDPNQLSQRAGKRPQ